MIDKSNVMEHLKKHMTYPATEKQLKTACAELSDFSKEDKEWFMKNLPVGTYQSAEAVMQAVGM